MGLFLIADRIPEPGLALIYPVLRRRVKPWPAGCKASRGAIVNFFNLQNLYPPSFRVSL